MKKHLLWAAAAALLVLLASCGPADSGDPYGCTFTLDGQQYVFDKGFTAYSVTPFASVSTLDGGTSMVATPNAKYPPDSSYLMLALDGSSSGTYNDANAGADLLVEGSWYGLISNFTVTITEFGAIGGDIRGTFSGLFEEDGGTDIFLVDGQFLFLRIADDAFDP